MSAPVFIMTPDTVEPAGSSSRREALTTSAPSSLPASPSSLPASPSAPPASPSAWPGSRGSLSLPSLEGGDELVLTGPEARHAVTVRRLRESERVDLVDGSGLRLVCAVTRAGDGARDRLGVRVVERLVEPLPPVGLALVQALAKGGRDEQAVETATEVGVETVVPWQARRCVSVWSSSRRARGRQRWQATAREAAKQARRAVVPQVGEARSTVELAAWVRRTVEAGGVVALLHEKATTPLSTLLATLQAPTATSGRSPQPAAEGHEGAKMVDAQADQVGAVAGGLAEEGGAAGRTEGAGERGTRPVLAVVVGPEGGIEEEETAVLEEAGAVTVRLGPHVMRTSSAGPLALAVLAQRTGLWEPGA